MRKDLLMAQPKRAVRCYHHNPNLYTVWRGMKERCVNPNHKNYNLYKGKLCDDWYDFKKFEAWAIQHEFRDGLSIDRIDTSKGYSPDNCQFLTKSENTIKGNRERRVVEYLIDGQWMTGAEVQRNLNVKRHYVHNAVKSGKIQKRRNTSCKDEKIKS